MSGLIYLLVEGVHDAAFVGKVLSVCFGAQRIETMEELDDATRSWMGLFKWPMAQAGRTPIRRLAVPAPAFYRIAHGALVGVRNAQGITEIGKTLSIDHEAFKRASLSLSAVGIVLDSDDKLQTDRHADVRAQLERHGIPAPNSLGEVIVGPPRVGVFAMPATGKPGTLEDVLLALGGAAYPDLAAVAGSYAQSWHAKVAHDASDEWKELKKPTGIKKATIGAMAAVLKPGKATQVSLEDHRWVSDATKNHEALAPCLDFLRALVGAPAAASPGAAS
ncbi:DUF3226 domain-containing protein [Sorangium sp. So ce341]|uniref:DUF3226 domain-containing protein n=1 Tax=Sorangium sp. So ce341 TaxID=3133302 RepID=UPI003F5F0D79